MSLLFPTKEFILYFGNISSSFLHSQLTVDESILDD